MKTFILTFLGVILCFVGAIVITSLEMPWLLRFILCVIYGWWLGHLVGKGIAK